MLTWNGTLWLALLERSGLLPQERALGLDHFALTVEDSEFDAAVTELEKDRVPIINGPITRGAGRSVYFTDPDGLTVELHTSGLDARMVGWR